MTQIFLNYRSEDDEAFGVAMLDQALSDRFGDDAVFLASKSVELGSAWETDMFEAVKESSALLVIMGRRWLDAKDENGGRRIDDPKDFVRREILTALELGKKVIPVRLASKRLKVDDLPEELRPLISRQDIEVRFRNYRVDVELLAQRLRQEIPELRKAVPSRAADGHGRKPVDSVTRIGNQFNGPFHFRDFNNYGPAD
ncbi:toll/interleukin-1 receptor domain-containing protein [Amycolatopsis sp. cmx-11-12]|uniref:toll/interleukin-1 receptor domain-containing protein n=1 Tax=Amycolatopsis sp. cmx-11-12 TaxID=2785795 RepID=UPI003916F654